MGHLYRSYVEIPQGVYGGFLSGATPSHHAFKY